LGLPQVRLQAVRPLPFSPSLPFMPSMIPVLSKSFVPPVGVHAPSFLPPPGQVTADARPAPNSVLVDVDPWIEAAGEFIMNTDFDVSMFTRSRPLDLPNIMTIMKEQSTNKRTIQALADKITLNRLLDNMNVPQMPALLCINNSVSLPEIQNLVLNCLANPETGEVVIKPTHLSNGTGVILVSPPKPEEIQPTIDLLHSHIGQFLNQQAGAHESVAMRSLKPGFIVQPKYKSSTGFKTPLEVRTICLWGKARLALWWWGRGGAPDDMPHRNVWLVRRPTNGALTDSDTWDFVHKHQGSNPGFEKAIDLFREHIHSMAACAEAIATTVGAPFLRSDFFVGSPRWGVRLNEVAYGCGVDYRNMTENGEIVDDAPSIARILQEGMTRCRKKLQPEHFLARVGARGNTYNDLQIAALPHMLRPALPADAEGLGVGSNDECVVPEELCRTVHHGRMGRSRGSSWGPGRRQAGNISSRSHSWYAGAPQAPPSFIPAVLAGPLRAPLPQKSSFHNAGSNSFTPPPLVSLLPIA